MRHREPGGALDTTSAEDKKRLRDFMSPGIWLMATGWPFLIAVFSGSNVQFLKTLPADTPKLDKMVGEWHSYEVTGYVMFGGMLLIQLMLWLQERKGVSLKA